MDPASIPQPIRDILDQDEQVRWWDQPSPVAYVGNSLVLTMPLGLIAVISALTWVGTAKLGAMPAWTLVVLGLVLLFAAHMVVLRPLLNLRHAQRTYYAITDRRALALCCTPKPLVHDLTHDQGQLVVIERGGGQGLIRFDRVARSSLEVLIFGRAAIPGFYGLRQVKEPAALLRQLRQEQQ